MSTHVTFAGTSRLAIGSLAEIALASARHTAQDPPATLLTFELATGKVVDLDLRGDEAAILARYHVPEPPRGRGRPKLGVVAREITLLPRHWDWLNAQPGGASIALRKLVETASRVSAPADRHRQTRDAAYHFMATMAGDFQHFEEASRALFAGNIAALQNHIASWPGDVANQLIAMLAEPIAAETKATSVTQQAAPAS